MTRPSDAPRLAREARRLLMLAVLVVLLPWTALTGAQSGTPAPVSPSALPADAQEILHSERFRRLALELRCMVCQNQSLADSNAPLAQDLRNEVVRLIASGRDDRAIKTFLVDRYGEFVLYRPPVSARNALLWAGPFALLAIGAFVWWRLGRRASTATSPGATPSGIRPGAPGTTAPADGAADARDALRRVDDLLGR